MGLEVRQMIVRSRVTSEPERGPSDSQREADRRALREELLAECRRLIERTWDARGER